MACTAEGVAPHVGRVAFDLEAGPVSPALQWLHATIISTINTRLCTSAVLAVKVIKKVILLSIR